MNWCRFSVRLIRSVSIKQMSTESRTRLRINIWTCCCNILNSEKRPAVVWCWASGVIPTDSFLFKTEQNLRAHGGFSSWSVRISVHTLLHLNKWVYAVLGNVGEPAKKGRLTSYSSRVSLSGVFPGDLRLRSFLPVLHFAMSRKNLHTVQRILKKEGFWCFSREAAADWMKVDWQFELMKSFINPQVDKTVGHQGFAGFKGSERKLGCDKKSNNDI